MLDVDQGCGDDGPDLPRAQADDAEGLERRLEQAVAAFTNRAEPVVGLVERLL